MAFVFRAVGVVLNGFALACAGPSAPAGPDLDLPEQVVDISDRCATLPPHCLEGYDASSDDGCPDPPPPVLTLPIDALTVPPKAERVLEAVAMDARRLVKGAELLIAAEALPAETDSEIARRVEPITRELISRRVPIERLGAETIRVLGRPPHTRIIIGVQGCPGVSIDADEDGVRDFLDGCPDEPEDLDGDLDEDGCPDFDHDCQPIDPENEDGTCGDLDRDGVADADDRCPELPGAPFSAGCPEPR